MRFLLEEQLEQFIIDYKDNIHEKGLPKFYKHTIRQVALPSEKIVDILTYEIVDDTLNFRIIELKKEAVYTDAIIQVMNYFATIGLATNNTFSKVNADMILIGGDISSSTLFLSKYIKNMGIYKYELGLNGITFKKQSILDLKFRKHSKGENWCNSLANPLIWEGFLCTQEEYDKCVTPLTKLII